jgi:membrane associated rhomboid family serine protease
VKFPHSKILTLIPFFIFFTAELPALLVLGYWFVIQFFSGVGSVGHSGVNDTGGVAWWAHVGGFLAGMLLIKIMRPKPAHWHRRDLAW